MLHELVKYAEREGLNPEPGFKAKTIRWLLVFSAKKQFLGVQDLRADDRKSKGREFAKCPDLTQPEMVSIGTGCRHFLVDNLEVVCLFTKDGKVDDKSSTRHDFFVSLLDEAGKSLPRLAPVAKALREEAILKAIRAKLSEGKAKPTELATLAIMDAHQTSILVACDHWHDWWRVYRRRMADGQRSEKSEVCGRKADRNGEMSQPMRCLLSGELTEAHATHDKVAGLADVGGLARVALVSFDKDAFTSFRLEQSANAAMSEAMANTYVTAIDHLIQNRSRRLAGAKVVYWYDRRVEPKDDPLPEIFDGFGPPTDEDALDQERYSRAEVAERMRAESTAGRLLDAIRSGERPELKDYHYFAVTLSANGGRVVVRDWMEGQFSELLKAVEEWFRDVSIIRRDGRGVVPSHKLGAVLAAPVRELGDVTAPMVVAIWRCILKRLPIPHEVMVKTLQRVRLDIIRGETPLHARFGVLKAYCNRNERTPNMKPELNEYESDPAYVCGRIMAILANIQRTALGDVGAGVVQRYYAAASSTPALVLGRLVRLAQTGHLPKIGEKGLQSWFERQLAEVWARLDCRPPTVLTLDDQTLFAMGYYQQIAKRYDKNNTDKTAATTVESAAAE